jgi:hypothetical protein
MRALLTEFGTGREDAKDVPKASVRHDHTLCDPGLERSIVHGKRQVMILQTPLQYSAMSLGVIHGCMARSRVHEVSRLSRHLRG